MKRLGILGLLFWGFAVSAQKRISLKAEAWTFRPGIAAFDDSAGMARLKVIDGRGFVVLKDLDFTDGTIEFDILPTNHDFASFFFRFQDTAETETFYLRTNWAVNHPYAMEAVQYTPIVKGVMYWDALPQYQTFSDYTLAKASHVKMIVSGKQMKVWVNHPERPTLEVPRLEGDVTHGTLAFQGEQIITNLIVKPGQVEGLSPVEGTDVTGYDSRYLRHWWMVPPDTANEDVRKANLLGIRGLPGAKAVWKPVDAERRGFVNLSRIFGATVPFGVPRMMFLKTTIQAREAKMVQLRLGFLDDVAVFVNDRLIKVDKNNFGFPVVKVPNGRLSIENSTVELPLKAGDNVVMLALGGNFFSWGIVARLDDMDGLVIER
ncbi:MAG TPA: hypothetical protein VHE34_08380 [Puia sp.]|uniref:hypothetical protein n=1 Tax=Puia sp. TaxID=2045100 RepID=UPI002C6882E3|nr:hypothetical protein [Puia sp.]HVU95225.1 hypothetical protein [Puia sp.]